MTQTVAKRPYEFLARWDTRTGQLQGAHVGFASVIEEDGQFVSEVLLPVQPVAIGGAEGFPLADILTQLQADAIAGRDAATAALSVAQAELATTSAALEAAQAELAQLKGEAPQIVIAQS